MLLWVLLFILILIVSLLLALYSMNDYVEFPETLGNSVFLIQKPQGLTLEVLNQLYRLSLSRKPILSFEGLHRGEKFALIVFGPTIILNSFADKLGLLELEDYSQQLKAKEFSAWEVGMKSSGREALKDFKIVLPALTNLEQFWWQVVLQPVGGNVWGNHLPDTPRFQTVIRAVVQTDDLKRIETLQSELSKIGNSVGLARLPQLYTSQQIFKFYRSRALPQTLTNFNKKGSRLVFTSEEVLALVN